MPPKKKRSSPVEMARDAAIVASEAATLAARHAKTCIDSFSEAREDAKLAVRAATQAESHFSSLQECHEKINNKLDAIAHVKVNGSVGLEPALNTLYEYAKSNKQNIEQIKEETLLMRDLHKVYAVYLKHGSIRFLVKALAVVGIGQLVGFSIKEVLSLLK